MDCPVIFIVDDDAAVRKAVRRLLTPLRYAVCAFASAEQFLAQTQSGAPGCLILDMRLPGITGLQLQKHLADHAWRLPVIFITAHGDPRSREEALRGGAVDYLLKPFDCDRLLHNVREAMSNVARPAPAGGA